MRIRSPLLVKTLSYSAVGLLRLLCATCRKRMFPYPGTSLYEKIDETFLYSAWHDAIILSLLAKRTAPNLAALASMHRDGGWVVEMLNAIGVKPVRGSTSKGGARALRELIEVTRENHVAITSDGPRGPRREIKSGIVYLAAKTGRRIVPAGYACSRSWNVKGSWTEMQLPRPFSTIYAVGEEPIAVPQKVDREGLEHYTRLLQAAMDRAAFRAEAYARGEEPDLAAYDGAIEIRRAA